LSALTQKPPAAAATKSNAPNIHFFILLPQRSSFNQSLLSDINVAAAEPSLALHQITAPKRSEFIAKAGW